MKKNESGKSKQMIRKTIRKPRPPLAPLNISTPSGFVSEDDIIRYAEGPTQILPWLFLGDLQDAHDIKFHTKNNIENIISLGPIAIKHPAIKLLFHIDIQDKSDEPIDAHFKKIFKVLDSIRDKGERVLVHCKGGISRSATVVIAYQMSKSKNHKLNDAWNYVQEKRPKIDPNLGFQLTLQNFERTLNVITSCTICGQIVTGGIRMHLDVYHNMDIMNIIEVEEVL